MFIWNCGYFHHWGDADLANKQWIKSVVITLTATRGRQTSNAGALMIPSSWIRFGSSDSKVGKISHLTFNLLVTNMWLDATYCTLLYHIITASSFWLIKRLHSDAVAFEKNNKQNCWFPLEDCPRVRFCLPFSGASIETCWQWLYCLLGWMLWLADSLYCHALMLFCSPSACSREDAQLRGPYWHS